LTVEGNTVWIRGVPYLTGADVEATDLRAGAALVVAGLTAKGVTRVGCVQHIDRGYDRLEEMLRSLGGRIYRDPRSHTD
jgi:UDP-N-acetylglucosamine 1-carboxyvinyltransferase